jgi:hypothetical protein
VRSETTFGSSVQSRSFPDHSAIAAHQTLIQTSKPLGDHALLGFAHSSSEIVAGLSTNSSESRDLSGPQFFSLSFTTSYAGTLTSPFVADAEHGNVDANS